MDSTTKGNCMIWDEPALVDASNGRDGKELNSPRAGGRYFITGTATTTIKIIEVT